MRLSPVPTYWHLVSAPPLQAQVQVEPQTAQAPELMLDVSGNAHEADKGQPIKYVKYWRGRLLKLSHGQCLRQDLERSYRQSISHVGNERICCAHGRLLKCL